MTPLSHFLHTQACQNAWANQRLYSHVARLREAEFSDTTRCSFFPSISLTLNHILTVDWYYLDALERELAGLAPHADCYRFFEPEYPFAELEPLWQAQRDADQRLLRYTQVQASDAELLRTVTIARPHKPQHDSRLALLGHLFAHQTHHRGQVHAMLSGTSVKPPQLDEFYCAGEAHLRAEDLAEIGLSEQLIWPTRS